MAKVKNSFARVDTILSADVANSGTFTVGYPAGFAQSGFLGGLAGSNHYMIVNGNDKWTAADGKLSLAFGASLITVTNLTGATLAAGSAVNLYADQVDGNDAVVLTFAADLANIGAAGDVITNFRPGIAGKVEYFAFVTDKPVTTAAKLASFNLEIGTTDLTGGVIALTSALATPRGKVIEATDITGNNAIGIADVLSIEATAVTAFVEGSGTFVIRIRRTPSDAY